MNGPVPVCGTCGHKHTTDLTVPSASGCADHSWTDACPYYGTACPPPEERQLIIDRLSRDWLHDQIKSGPVTTIGPLRKPLTMDDLLEAMDRISGFNSPPRRTEPIKLTPGQWAILPHGDPRAAPPYARPLGDILGIPVVMVDTPEESTPVTEGWIRLKRFGRIRRRLGLRWWQRGGSR